MLPSIPIGRLARGAFQSAAVLSLVAAASASPQSDGGISTTSPQPLDLRPGCWTLTASMSITGLFGHLDPEAARQMTLSMTPAQRDSYIAAINAQMDQNEAKAEKGMVSTATVCVTAQNPQLFLETLDTHAYLTNPHCDRTLRSSPRATYVHWVCTGSNGTGEQTNDYVRIDEENFKGTLHAETRIGTLHTATKTVTGKWVSDLAPHMPSGTTYANGTRPKGMDAVASMDPFRVVATSDGKQITAWTAWGLFRAVFPQWDDPEQKLSRADELRLLYMHKTIADEAKKLHLDLQEPWVGQLKAEGLWDLETRPQEFGENVIDNILHADEYRRESILWDSYLSQVSGRPAKEALAKQVEERFKLTIVDPDFFVEPAK